MTGLLGFTRCAKISWYRRFLVRQVVELTENRHEGSVAVQKNDQADKFIIPIGPQHPALKEPGHFEFTVDGEIVTGATIRLGYVHRGIEKATESRTWVQNLYLLERVCGICSHIHATAYCLGVERLAGLSVPPRAQAIRELVVELERIHSHMLWLGVAAHEAGFDTLFMYSWRDRETVMDILEGLTGNRVHYSANILGGVKIDVDAEQTKTILQGVDFLEKRTHHYLDVVTTDSAFVQRTAGIAVMSKAVAEHFGAVGPTARASGVTQDIRIDAPYLAYEDFPVEIVLDTAGDLKARFVVRVQELFQSYQVIRAILDKLPAGELAVTMPRRIKENETISRVEAPRGELFYYLKSNGTDKPERIKIRTPSICNFGTVPALAAGHQLADMPMILAGIDPCFSCNDRMVTIHRPADDSQTWTWEMLRQYGISYYREKER
ncbi:MAG: NADH dehydrogenase subunit [Chloroflexi bacterium]|nr:NADH dehydrogenase subunit [Chloroflexota bacterium]